MMTQMITPQTAQAQTTQASDADAITDAFALLMGVLCKGKEEEPVTLTEQSKDEVQTETELQPPCILAVLPPQAENLPTQPKQEAETGRPALPPQQPLQPPQTPQAAEESAQQTQEQTKPLSPQAQSFATEVLAQASETIKQTQEKQPPRTEQQDAAWVQVPNQTNDAPKQAESASGKVTENIPRIAEKIVEKASVLQKGETKELTIELTPRELGGLKMKITRSESGISATLVTASKETAHTLGREMATVTQALKEKGIELTNVSVYSSAEFAAQQESSGGQRHAWQEFFNARGKGGPVQNAEAYATANEETCAAMMSRNEFRA